MDKELKIRTIYGESYDKFKSIANKETTYLDYDLNVYAKYIIEYIDNLEQQCKKQQEVIDKAICYIQENTCWELRTSKVLDILNEVSE